MSAPHEDNGHEMNTVDPQPPTMHPRRNDTDPPPRYECVGRAIADTLTYGALLVRLAIICGAFFLAPAFRGLLEFQSYSAPLAGPAVTVLTDLDELVQGLLAILFILMFLLGVIVLLFAPAERRSLHIIPRGLSTPALLLYLWALAPSFVMWLAQAGAIG